MLKYEGCRGKKFHDILIKEYLDGDGKGCREQVIELIWDKDKDEVDLMVFAGEEGSCQHFVCNKEKMKEILNELQEVIDD